MQETTNVPMLSYGKAPPNRRWLVILLFRGGGIIQSILWFALQFSREVRWVDHAAPKNHLSTDSS